MLLCCRLLRQCVAWASGKLVIELFEDYLPTTVALFRQRCSFGSSQWLKDSHIDKIQSAYAVFGGSDSRCGTCFNILDSLAHAAMHDERSSDHLIPSLDLLPETCRGKAPAHGMRRNQRLRHAGYGAVSLAVDGSGFAISLGRSLKLDDTHQV